MILNDLYGRNKHIPNPYLYDGAELESHRSLQDVVPGRSHQDHVSLSLAQHARRTVPLRDLSTGGDRINSDNQIGIIHVFYYRSQFLLDRLGRCLKLFVSVVIPSSHEFASQQNILYS